MNPLNQVCGQGVVINPQGAMLNQVNAILCGRNNIYCAEDYRGTLSIKCMFNGQAFYEAGGGHFAVDDASYLVLNNDQTYTLTIDSDTIVETFCLFFRPGFAEDVLRSLVTPADRMLEDPMNAVHQPVLFFEKLYPHDDAVTPAILALRCAAKNGNALPGWMEEQFHLVLERMLYVHRSLGRQIEEMPAVRAATRVELYRRLHRARDFMDASLDRRLTLERIAEVAWLSPHHFLRLFKQTFSVTPHQYLTRKRLEKAQHLLLSTDQPIVQIAMETGLESHSAFSRLFRSHLGVPPETFRRTKGNLPAK